MEELDPYGVEELSSLFFGGTLTRDLDSIRSTAHYF
jgi:hypothetical protein